MDCLAILAQEITTIGDLNFHFDDPRNDSIRRFTGQLDAHGLLKHALYVVITNWR